MNLTGIYEDNPTSGPKTIYYVHQFNRQLDGTQREVLGWFSETKDAPRTLVKAASVFFGIGTASDFFEGDGWDVPKGNRQETHRLKVRGSLASGRLRLTIEIDGSGRSDLSLIEVRANSAANWTTLSKKTAVPSGMEHGSGFYDDNLLSLTGVWKSWPDRGTDYGMYYARQVGRQLIAFGEHVNPRSNLAWSSVYIGTMDDREQNRRIDGFWFDVPKATRPLVSGIWKAESRPAQIPFVPSREISLPYLEEVEIKSSEIPSTPRTNDAPRPGKDTAWVKTDSVRVNFSYQNLFIKDKADDAGPFSGGGDEPYVIPFFFPISGETLSAYQILVTRAGGAERGGVQFNSPLEDPNFQTGDWPKNNLTWQEDLNSGTMLTIPDFVGYHESVIRPVWGLQPNTRQARRSARYVAGLIVLEEQHTDNDVIRKAYQWFRDKASSRLNQLMWDAGSESRIRSEDVDGWVRRIVDTNPTPPAGKTIESIVASTLLGEDTSGRPDVNGFKEGRVMGLPSNAIFQDRVLGVSVKTYTFDELYRLAKDGRVVDIPLSFNSFDSQYRISASMYVNLSADVPVKTVNTLELSLFTADDDKRDGFRGSVVRVQASNSSDLNLLPTPWVVGDQREKFENWSFKNARLPISPPLAVSNLRNLKIDFVAGGRGEFPWEGADQWKLQGVRMAAYDSFGKRRLLLNNYSADGTGYFHHFTGSETVTFTLP